jgi:hypothetical protein
MAWNVAECYGLGWLSPKRCDKIPRKFFLFVVIITIFFYSMSGFLFAHIFIKFKILTIQFRPWPGSTDESSFRPGGQLGMGPFAKLVNLRFIWQAPRLAGSKR